MLLNTRNTESSSCGGECVSSTGVHKAARIVPGIKQALNECLLTNGICPLMSLLGTTEHQTLQMQAGIPHDEHRDTGPKTKRDGGASWILIILGGGSYRGDATGVRG